MMPEPPNPQPFLDDGPDSPRDAGAVFVLESKGSTSPPPPRFPFFDFKLIKNLTCVCVGLIRAVVARRVPSDYGDSGADDPDAAVRFPRAGMAGRVPLLDRHGSRDVLLLLPHVEGSRPLREGRPPPHQVPGARRRRVR